MLRSSQLVYISLELLTALLAVGGNVLVVWAVVLNSRLQTITNLFVVSLAVADVAVGLVAVPFAVTISVGLCANFHGCLFMACLILVLTQGSIFSLLAIAIDRHIAIRNPLRYGSLVTGHRAKATIALCWLLSTVIGMTPMMGWNTGWNSTISNGSSSSSSNSSSSSCPSPLTRCQFEGVVTLDYMIYFNFLGCVLLPLLVMTAIYAHIFAAARRQLRLTGPKVALAPPPTTAARSRLRAELHAARSLALLVGVFALCWLPLHLLNSYHRLCQGCRRSPDTLMSAAIVLSHANSAINPVIYACRLSEFRLAFCKIPEQKVVRCCRRQGAVRPCEACITPSSSHVSQEDSSCITVVDGDLDQTQVGSSDPGGSVEQLPRCIVGFNVERGAGAGDRGGGGGLQ
ncbi:adenosine receptor A2b-like [Nelusetta ayraudi]|uniref:adenosine receptor A2b-like n=1 Tax=Nelusetta ayraudi TaxID=303726 RepID=UPI003F6F1D76